MAGWSWLVLETSWFILAKTGRAESTERKTRVDRKRMVEQRSSGVSVWLGKCGRRGERRWRSTRGAVEDFIHKGRGCIINPQMDAIDKIGNQRDA